MSSKKGSLDNSYPRIDENSESCHRDYKWGRYYDGNTPVGPEVNYWEGSQGLAIDQGFERLSLIVPPALDDNHQVNPYRFKEDSQGTAGKNKYPNHWQVDDMGEVFG